MQKSSTTGVLCTCEIAGDGVSSSAGVTRGGFGQVISFLIEYVIGNLGSDACLDGSYERVFFVRL